MAKHYPVYKTQRWASFVTTQARHDTWGKGSLEF